MSILRKIYEPAYKAEVIPGSPGIPPSPAYCVDEVVHHDIGYKVIYTADPGDPATGRPPGVFAEVVSTGPWSEVVHTCYPATEGVPGTPPTTIPAVEAKYYAGWNAAADSIPSLAGDGIYQVTADASAVGIVTGITPAPVGVTYGNITHGIYFASGQYQYIENGTPVSPKGGFNSADVFTIVRIGTQVTFYKGNTLDYTSLTPSTGLVWADASLYFGNDAILNALFDTTIPPGKSGVGQQGTFDGPLPPGNYPPATPPGGVPRYTSVNGILQGVHAGVFGANQINLPPGPNPGDPGLPPTVDGNGDWAGRSGGTLRELVGKFIGNSGTGYNYGSVAGILTPVKGVAFSIGGASTYSILSGTLTPVFGNTGADLLTPQYAVMNGYLGGIGGFSYGLYGPTNDLVGKMLGLRGLATNLAGGSIGTGGSTLPDTGGGGGPPVALFHDTYTGSTTLDLHVPDVGVAYVNDGCHPIDELSLTGSGGLPISDGLGNSYCIEQPLNLTGLTSLTVTQAVQLDAIVPGSTLYVDTALDKVDTDDWLYEMYLEVQVDGTIHFSGFVYALDGTQLYGAIDSPDVTSAFTLGVPHTITMEITPSGVVWKLDGVEVDNSGGVLSDGPLDTSTGVEQDIHNSSGGATHGFIDEITVTVPVSSGGSSGGELVDPTTGDWDGRSGGYLRNIVGLSYSADAIRPADGIFIGELSSYILQASGHSIFGVFIGLDATLSGYSFVGYGGGSAIGELPLPTFIGSGTVTILGEADLALSGYAFLGSGTTHILGRAYITYQGTYALTGYGGGQLDVVHGGHYLLSGHGIGGAIGKAVGELPTPFLVASGTVHNFGGVIGILPSVTVAASGIVVVTLSHYGFVGTGYEGFATTTAYEGYSVTLIPAADGGGETTATTHYPNYPFDRILRFGDDYYGVAADGLYRLDGNTFDGVEIISVVETAQTDFKERSAKRPVSLFLAGRMDTKLKVSVTAAEDEKNTYTYTGTWEGVGNQRVRFGRGIKARYLSYGFTNHTGEDFDVDELAPEIEVLRRNQ